MVNIDTSWLDLLGKLKINSDPQIIYVIGANDSGKSIYVIGANDSGKSTLCRFLSEHLSPQFSTAYIDCDPGQSVIGPPTTIGLEKIAPPGKSPADPRYLCFVGSTTPRGHLLQTLAGIKKLADQATRLGAQRIIVDSCGFVLEKSAREFQFHVIDLLRPNFLVVIQKPLEIIKWAGNFRRNFNIEVNYLSSSPSVVQRTPIERRSYREEKFRSYFADARLRELPLKRIGFFGRVPNLHHPDRYRQLIVALCDADNFVITLGIVQDIDLDNRLIRLHALDFDPDRVAFVHFGSIYLDVDGKQLFYSTLF